MLYEGGMVMPPHLRCLLLVVTTLVGLVYPLQQSEAYTVTRHLTRTPVTGQLADGSAFRGQMTVHELFVDASGELAATGVLTGTVKTAPGTATTIAPRPFTALASLLDLRGTCATMVLDLAPIFLAPLEQEVMLVPVILSPGATQKEARELRTVLCALTRSQE
jgi:hypothetical protein